MRTICLATLAIGVPLLLLGCAGDPKPREPRTVEITRLEGPPLQVPLDGPLATPATRRIVTRRALESVDRPDQSLDQARPAATPIRSISPLAAVTTPSSIFRIALQ